MGLWDWLPGGFRGRVRGSAGDPEPGATRPEPTGSSDLVRDLSSVLAELSAGRLDVEDIDPAGHLFEFGYVDSLTAVSFVEHVERRYRVVIEDVELIDRLTSVDAIARRIEGGA